MRYRKTVNGDYSFGNNANDFLSGIQAVSQAIKTNLLLLYGEWWESKDEGLPLFQNILGQPGNPENLQATDLLIQTRILATPGAVSLKSFTSIYEDRTYRLSCIVETIYGDVDMEVPLPNVF